MSPSGAPSGVKVQSGATGAVEARNVKQLALGSLILGAGGQHTECCQGQENTDHESLQKSGRSR